MKIYFFVNIVLISLASIHTIITGLFYLRKKPTFLEGNRYYGFYVLVLAIIMFITIGATMMRKLSMESVGALVPLIFPVFMIIAISRLLNGWLILNLEESAISKVFEDSLKAMGINYERELTRIKLRDFGSEMRISIGHSSRTCSVYFVNRQGIKNYRSLANKVKEGISAYQSEPLYLPAFAYIAMGLLMGFGFLTGSWLFRKVL